MTKAKPTAKVTLKIEDPEDSEEDAPFAQAPVRAAVPVVKKAAPVVTHDEDDFIKQMEAQLLK